MPERVEIKVGQIWTSKDKRDVDNTIEVIRLTGNQFHPRVLVSGRASGGAGGNGGRMRSMMHTTLRTRYRLTKDVE